MPFSNQSFFRFYSSNTVEMTENGAEAQTGAGERVAIGITFGNSNSSIAYTIDDKPEVMANEDGGTCYRHVMGHRLELTSYV